MALRPLRDKIVVKVIDDTEQTSGGIFIPDSAKEKPQKGTVIAVGPGKMQESGTIETVPLKAGETVLFTKFAGTDVKYDGTDYKILLYRDILAVVE